VIPANIKVKIAIGFAVVIVATAVTTIYISKHSFEQTSPVISELNTTIFGVGSVEAKEVIVLAPKITAKIGSLFSDEGDKAHKGKVLAILEPSDLASSKEEAEAGLNKSKAQYDAQIAQLEDVKAKDILAQITHERYANLAKKGFVSQAELDQTIAAAKSAKAALDSANIGIQSAKADVKKSKALVATVSAKIDDLTLKAPVDAIVISRDAQKGSTVLAGASVFHLADPTTIWIKAFIDERQSEALRVGQQATITIRSNEKRKLRGIVRRIGVQSDRVTEEKEINIAFESIPSSITIGEQAEVTIITASYKSVLTLPRSAIVKKGLKTGVWLYADGRAMFREINVVAESFDAKIAVSGVSKDDKIIICDDRKIVEGMRIW